MTYICALCRGTFECGRPEEDTVAELRENFGHVPLAECDRICNDCYRAFMAWLKQQERGKQ